MSVPPGLARVVLVVLVVLFALHVAGFALSQAGGSSPAERGSGSPIELAQPR